MVRRTFIEKTLWDVSSTVERAFFAEEIARRPGLLQKLDPRVKVLAFLLTILVAASLRHLLPQAILLSSLITLALGTRISARFLLRTFLGLPLLTLLIASPALVLLPGPPLVDLPFGLTITKPGLASVVTLLLRVMTSLTAASLLVLTTRWAELLAALRALRVPTLFLILFAMTYRYLFVLFELTQDLLLARRSRLLAPLSGSEHRRWLGAALGVLFRRSIRTSEQVYLAMVARGFHGEFRPLQPPRFGDAEWLSLSLSSVFLASLCLLDLSR